MAKLLGTALRTGKKFKTGNTTLPTLTKDLIPGKSYKLFTRTFDAGQPTKDLLLALVAGRKLDKEVCGTSYYVFSESQIDISDDGVITDKTEFTKWARIMRVIFDAKCQAEKDEAKRKAVEVAERTGQQIDELALIRKYDAIDRKYYGAKEENRTIYATEKPAIQSLGVTAIAEFLLVPLDETGKPLFKDASYRVRELSNTLKDQLTKLSTDANYNDPEKDYMEIAFTFGSAEDGNDRAAAGRKSTYNGVAKSLSTEYMYPDLWEKEGKALVDGLCSGFKDVEEAAGAIVSHDYNTARTCAVADVVTAITKWCSNNLILFGSIDYKADRTKYAAKDLLESGLVSTMPKVVDNLTALVEAEEDETSVPETTTAPAQDAISKMAGEDGVRTGVGEVLGNNTAVGSLQQLQSIDLGDDDDSLGELA